LETTKKRTARTVRNYDLYLRRFAEWLKEKKIYEVDKIKSEHIKKYRLYLTKIKNPIKKIYLKSNTQSYHLIAIREFLDYLNNKNIKVLQKKDVKLDKNVRKKMQTLSDSDINKLLQAPKKIVQEKIITLRDLLIIELLYSTGARVSEIALLELSDLNIKKEEICLSKSGKKQRIFSLNNQAKHYFVEYFKYRKDSSQYLFIGHDRANTSRDDFGLSARSIERLILRYGQIVGIEQRVTPQVLRNTYIASQLNLGLSKEKTKNVLGLSVKNPHEKRLF